MRQGGLIHQAMRQVLAHLNDNQRICDGAPNRPLRRRQGIAAQLVLRQIPEGAATAASLGAHLFGDPFDGFDAMLSLTQARPIL